MKTKLSLTFIPYLVLALLTGSWFQPLVAAETQSQEPKNSRDGLVREAAPAKGVHETTIRAVLPPKAVAPRAFLPLVMADRDPMPPEPGMGYTGPIMIEVENYLDYQIEMQGWGPFYVYGWVGDYEIGGFDRKVSAVLRAGRNDGVVKTLLMFTSYASLEMKIAEIPPEVDGVFYNSEPGLSMDFDDIFLENTNNSVVQFVRLAKRHGLEAHWGPLRSNLDSNASDRVSETALGLMFEAGLDGIGLQEQQQIDTACVENLIWGPHSVGGHPADSVNETVTRLLRISGNHEFEVNVQIMPGYNHTDGCYPADDYAVDNCGLSPDHTMYKHCHDLAAALEAAGLADTISIWASLPPERAQLVNLIQALRQ